MAALLFVTFQVNYLFGFLVLVSYSFICSFLDSWPQLKFVSVIGEEKFSKMRKKVEEYEK